VEYSSLYGQDVPENILMRSAEIFQEQRAWLNFTAPLNISAISITLDVSHLDMSPLKEIAS